MAMEVKMRAYSPRLEMHAAIAAEEGRADDSDSCCAVVISSGAGVVTVEDVGGMRVALETAGTAAEGGGGGARREEVIRLPGDIEFVAENTEMSGTGNITAVLYAPVGAPCRALFHSALSQKAEAGGLRYVWRPALLRGCRLNGCSAYGSGGPLHLPGYGVELAIKNMEYKAIDDSKLEATPGDSDASETVTTIPSDEGLIAGFDFKTLMERYPDASGELLEFRDKMLEEHTGDINDMKLWDMKDLGLQAAQRIMQAKEPLKMMQDISHNFPSMASGLSRMSVNTTIRGTINKAQQMIRKGAAMLILNGRVLDVQDVEPFAILSTVRDEIDTVSEFKKLKLVDNSIKKLLKLPWKQKLGEVRVDLRDANTKKYPNQSILNFVNNIAKDERYRSWPKDIRAIFQSRLPTIRKNIFNAVYVIDPSKIESLEIARRVWEFYSRSVPIRFGFLYVDSSSPLDSDEMVEWEDATDSERIVRACSMLNEVGGKDTALRILAALTENDQIFDADALSWTAMSDAVERELGAMQASPAGLLKFNSVEEALEAMKSSTYAEKSSDARKWALRKGLPVGSLIFNGGVVTASDVGTQNLVDAANMFMQQHTQYLQQALMFGQISPAQDLNEYFLQGAFPRYSKAILDTDERNTVQFTGSVVGLESPFLKELVYLQMPGKEDMVASVTHLVVANVGTMEGKKWVRDAILAFANDTSSEIDARLGVLMHCGNNFQDIDIVTVIVNRIIRLKSRLSKRLPFLVSFLSSKDVRSAWFDGGPYVDEEKILKVAHKIAEQVGLSGIMVDSDDDVGLLHRLHVINRAIESMALDASKPALISNGNAYVATGDGDSLNLHGEDLSLVNIIEKSRGAEDVRALIEDMDFPEMDMDDIDAKFMSDVILVVGSILSKRAMPNRLIHTEYQGIDDMLDELHKLGSGIRVGTSQSVNLEWVVDPLSRQAQRLTPLLSWMMDHLPDQLAITVHLNPNRDLAELPLKSFYRFVLPAESSLTTPVASFSRVPAGPTLTLHMDVPESWLVEVRDAVYDLDNLQMEELGDEAAVTATFDLESIIVTGRASDEKRQPPNMLQVQMGNAQNPHIVDTLVMKNLGYFQLKAAPGLWKMRIAPDTRSDELYQIVSVNAGLGTKMNYVLLDSFDGQVIHFDVEKREGKEEESLLVADGEAGTRTAGGGGGLSAFSSFFGGLTATAKSSDKGEEEETINIFSVASGHLYERFIRIMIVSVLKHSKSPVKFWFIKNYLSPQFKRTIPYMATRLGFQYELVTYKWPTWLNKQTDKIRIIWANKILFLDVLFPQELKKVIFVDADQIVRSDMKELWDMDLQGAPYGYTPMCESNPETKGYRFWSQGFWKDHLRGKNYHISALYVVDLVRFRQMGAGDSLRVIYDQLSRDPNSLSNLDQDLPNYTQDMVPIFSLPQEWLWCESWCSSTSKTQAKTIDLCNNPMTKEPKLVGARRIVPEWEEYDDLQREIVESIDEQQHIIFEAGFEYEGEEKTLDLNAKNEL